MPTSLRIIFAGTPFFAAYHLNTLLFHGYNVIGVFTQPDRPSGRGKKITPSPVKILAEKNRIPIFQPISLCSKENQQLISNLNPDIMIVVAYGLILPKEVLDIPHFGCINVHGSLLPRWRGAAPIQRSLLAGDLKTGITIIKMDTGLDTGNILYKLSCPILNEDTSATLYKKLSKLGSKGLIETLQRITRKEITLEIQDESLVTYAKKLSKDEARIDWSLSATQIERCIRAFNPWPVSWIEIDGQTIKVWQASILKNSAIIEEDIGTIVKINKNGIQVVTMKDILNLELLQPSGKKIMSAWDFLNSRYKLIFPGRNLYR